MRNLELNINNFATKSRKLIEERFFRWSHDYPYVAVSCTNIGVLLTGLNKPVLSKGEEGIVQEKINGKTFIPDNIREAYGLNDKENFEFATLSENQWLMLGTPSFEPVLPTYNHKTFTFNKEKAKTVSLTTMGDKKISLFSLKNILPYTYIKATFSFKDALRIDIQEAKNDDCLTLDETKTFFGKHLQGFVGDTIVFKFNLEDTGFGIPFPAQLFHKAGLNYGTKLEVWQSTTSKNKTVFTIAPQNIEDMITGNEIDFKEENPQPVVICEECNENISNIRLIANEFLKLAQTFHDFAEKYDSMASENEKVLEENESLKARLLAAENKNAAILELLRA